MSKRNQDLPLERTSRAVHKIDKRRRRHEIAQVLHTIDDPEAAVVADRKVDHAPHHDARPRRRLRHWKMKAWKRRTSQRHRRNELAEELLRADD